MPTPDHLTIIRRFKRIMLETDGPRFVDTNPFHITALESIQPAA